MGTITHRELRDNSAEILRRVEAGETLQVTKNGVPAAVIGPAGGVTLDDLIAQGGACQARGIQTTRRKAYTTMARILITGMSGAGKSTLLNTLAARGHLTIDTDYDGWTLSNSVWDEHRMDKLLAQHNDVVISGTVENQGKFYDRFDHVVLLSAPTEVLIDRIANRTNNPYGHTREQQDEVRQYVVEVEPLLRKGATLELDGRQPVKDLAEAIEALP